MEEQLQQATIKIEEIIDKEKVVKIKAGGRTYNVFKKKKDGTDSIAYRNVNDLGLKAGMTIDVGYKDSQYDFQGKQTTSHNIAFFREPSIQVQEDPNFDEINAKKAQDIKEAQEIRKAEFDKLIFALDNLTNKIDQVLEKLGKDTSTTANVNGTDVNVDDIPFD